MNVTVDISQFAALAQLWQKAPELTRREMTSTMTDVDVLIQGELMRELPAGAGGAAGLRGSVFREEHALADNVIGLVATDKPYAGYVELGTKPHMPPIQPLVDWVRAKLGEDEESARGVAFAIARKIKAHGTKANPVWEMTLKRLQREIRRKFDAGIARIARQLAGGSA